MKKFALIIILSSLNSLSCMVEQDISYNTCYENNNKLIVYHEENNAQSTTLSAGSYRLANMIKARRTAVQLPSSNVLYQQLKSRDLGKFAEHTLIHKKLGNQTKTPVEIIQIIDNALYEYNNVIKKKEKEIAAAKHNIRLAAPGHEYRMAKMKRNLMKAELIWLQPINNKDDIAINVLHLNGKAYEILKACGFIKPLGSLERN